MWKISKNTKRKGLHFDYTVESPSREGNYLVVFWLNASGNISYSIPSIYVNNELPSIYTKNHEIIIRIRDCDTHDEIVDGVKVLDGKLEKLSMEEISAIIKISEYSLP